MDQSLALSLLKSGHNVFLTGQAGSGKTYVINQFVEWLWACGLSVALTASTGIAATHIGGVTIHSRSGIGIKESLSPRDIDHITQNETVHKNISHTKVLIIDEISMLSAMTLDMVDQVIQNIRRDHRPFGGLQVVLVGDFFQLPPIVPRNPDGSESTKRFAFAAGSWKSLNPAFCYLTTQYRQADDHFSRLLNELRVGKLSDAGLDLLRTRIHASLYHPCPVTIHTHNLDVDRINSHHLAQLPSAEYFFYPTTEGDPRLCAGIVKSMLVPEELVLKIGARVMFVKNNPQKGYFNGTTGEITGFAASGQPMVKVMTNVGDERIITVAPEAWSIEQAEEVVARVMHTPLKLARAITVHKSQGMTIDFAQINLAKVFEPGQGYVALSRLRSIEGLCLQGLDERGLTAHPLVIRGDTYFRAQSDMLEEKYSLLTETERQAIHSRFVQAMGGTYRQFVSPKTDKPLASPKAKLSRKGSSPTNTIDETLRLVKEGKTMTEIVAIRDLVESTIWKHFLKIRSLYPDVSLDRYKPDAKLMKKVQAAVVRLQKIHAQKSEPIGLRQLFDELDGKIDFDTLKQCLLFIK